MKLNHWARLFSVLLCGLLIVLSCGNDNPSDLTDTTPPARVTTLSVDSVTTSGALLTWTATGDDNNTGNASEYDIRYSLQPDSSANWWDSLTVTVTDSLAPKAPGEMESLLVGNLLPDTLYYFGLVVLDEAGNESALSNVARDTTDSIAAEPVLAITPDSLAFGSEQTEKTFNVTNTGTGTLSWTITESETWLEVSPDTGSTMTEEDAIIVTVSRSGLSAGSYSGTVTVDPNAGSPQMVDVSMTVFGGSDPGAMVLVPSGSFTMGDGTAYCGTDERTVTLTNSFYLGKYEVTNGEYRDALQWAYNQGHVTATSSTVQDNMDGSTVGLVDLGDDDCEISFSGGTFTVDSGKEDHPMKEVYWYGAVCYCDWISLQAGLPRAYDHSGDWSCNGGDPYTATGYRLPTDAEWEYAAQYDDERIYPWGNESPNSSRVNYNHNVGWTSPVGSYPAAPVALDLYDMAGNVWEWCNDWHECDLGTGSEMNPIGPVSGSSRLLRGGSLGNDENSLRATYRYGIPPSNPNFYYAGFRCVRSH